MESYFVDDSLFCLHPSTIMKEAWLGQSFTVADGGSTPIELVADAEPHITFAREDIYLTLTEARRMLAVLQELLPLVDERG